MSELEAIILARPAAEALASFPSNLPTALIPDSPHGLFDSAHASSGNSTLSALSVPPLQAQSLLRPLDQISAPHHLPAGLLLVSTSHRNLALSTPSPFGFDFHWLRHVATGILRGTTGIRLDASTQARISASLSGRFLAAVTRHDIDGQPAIRLVLSSSSSPSNHSLQASAGATVSAQADIPLPDSPDQLLHALLGVHPIQWARDAMNEIGSVRFTRIAHHAGVAPAILEKLLNAWRTFGARAEGATWHALSSASAWQQFRQWTAWLASSPDEAAVLARLRHALDSDPSFASSPSARWIEAVAAAPLSALPTPGFAGRLRPAAALIEDLSSQPALEKLMLQLPVKALRELNPNDLWPWAKSRLEDLLGEITSSAGLAAKTAPWIQLRNRVYAASRQALAAKLNAEISILLSRSSQDSALADVSFPFTSDGLALFRQVLAGDLSPLFAPHSSIRLRRGLLSHQLRRARHIEIHLPFLDRREWINNREALASAEVSSTPDGRLIVDYSVEAAGYFIRQTGAQSALVLSAALSARDGEPIRDNCTLAFTDTRTVSADAEHAAWLAILDAYGLPLPALPAAPCQATLSLSIPGHLADAWTTAPHSRDEQYFPTMCRVSRALQAMSRRWLPALFLSSIDAYHTPSAVHPLLAWSCSQPYTGIKKGQFGYDFMDPAAIERALSSSMRTLPGALESIRLKLIAAGRLKQATYYHPEDARYILAGVLRQRRHFTALLSADNFFIEEVIRLADCARELRSLAASRPDIAVRNLTRYSDALVQAFHRRLRRLYAKKDFLALGPLFLLEATAALNGHSRDIPRIAASLQLQINGQSTLSHNPVARLAL